MNVMGAILTPISERTKRCSEGLNHWLGGTQLYKSQATDLGGVDSPNRSTTRAPNRAWARHDMGPYNRKLQGLQKIGLQSIFWNVGENVYVILLKRGNYKIIKYSRISQHCKIMWQIRQCTGTDKIEWEGFRLFSSLFCKLFKFVQVFIIVIS